MSDGLITRQELSQELNEELNQTSNKIGLLSNVDPALQASLQGQEKDINLVNVANEIYHEVIKPDYTPTLTQIASIFSAGTGYDKDGNYIDMSESIVNGQVSSTIRGRTITNILGDNGGGFDTGIFKNWIGRSGATITNGTRVNVSNKSIRVDSADWGASAYSGMQTSTSYLFKAGKKYLIRFGYFSNFDDARLVISTLQPILPNTSTVAGLTEKGYKYAPASDITTPIIFDRRNTNTGLLEVDGIAIYEISDDDYNDLTEQELLQKYNWISGTKSTISQRITSRGKNLFDENQIAEDWTYKEPTIKQGQRFAFAPIRIKPNTSYYFQSFIPIYTRYFIWLDQNLNFIGQSSNSSTSVSPNNAYYVQPYIYDGVNNLDRNNLAKNLMLIEGDTPSTEYKPHENSTSYVILPDGEELRSLPNGTYDEVSEGKLKKRTGKVSLNKTNFTPNNNEYRINIQNIKRANAWNVFTDYLLVKNDAEIINEVASYNDVNSPTEIGWAVVDTNGNLYISKALYDALTDTDTLTFIYQLAEEQSYDINVTPLEVFEDGTITITPIEKVNDEWVDADPSESTIPETEFTYPVNQAGVVANLNSAVSIQSKILRELLISSI